MSESREFVPLDIAVLTVSDSRDESTDKSGPLLVSMLTEAGHRLADKTIVPDDKYRIREVVSRWIVDEELSFATALASCLAKYARELVMEGFNAYFEELQPGLKPTAGYRNDGWRWLSDAEHAVGRSGLDRDTLVRKR